MPKKKPTKTKRVKKSDAYENGKRKKDSCPKCGPGVFLADHKDRQHCGKCGYTKMKQ